MSHHLAETSNLPFQEPGVELFGQMGQREVLGFISEEVFTIVTEKGSPGQAGGEKAHSPGRRQGSLISDLGEGEPARRNRQKRPQGGPEGRESPRSQDEVRKSSKGKEKQGLLQTQRLQKRCVCRGIVEQNLRLMADAEEKGWDRDAGDQWK